MKQIYVGNITAVA